MSHRQYRRMAVLAIYGELSEKEQARFQRHISRCADCAGWYERTSHSLRTLGAGELAGEPPGLKTRILRGLEEELAMTSRRRAPARPLRWRVPRLPVPRYALVGAAAVLLLAAGYVAGRLAPFTPGTPDRIPARGDGGEGLTVAQAQKVSDYLERTRALLIGIVNIPEAAGPGPTVDLGVASSVSRGLLQESRSLRDELRSPEAVRVRRLIAELELLLLQISNLEKNQGGATVTLVREGLERGGIMLRITIERIGLDERIGPRDS